MARSYHEKDDHSGEYRMLIDAIQFFNYEDLEGVAGFDAQVFGAEALAALKNEDVFAILLHLRSGAPTPYLAATALQTLTCNYARTPCN